MSAKTGIVTTKPKAMTILAKNDNARRFPESALQEWPDGRVWQSWSVLKQGLVAESTSYQRNAVIVGLNSKWVSFYADADNSKFFKRTNRVRPDGYPDERDFLGTRNDLGYPCSFATLPYAHMNNAQFSNIDFKCDVRVYPTGLIRNYMLCFHILDASTYYYIKVTNCKEYDSAGDPILGDASESIKNKLFDEFSSINDCRFKEEYNNIYFSLVFVHNYDEETIIDIRNDRNGVRLTNDKEK